MKALVTGGTGLLGSHVVDALCEQGHEVRALVRKTSDVSHLKTTKAQLVVGSLSDYNVLVQGAKGVDVVFHSAGKVTPGWGTWEEFEETTVKGTENMIKAAIEAGVPRFLHVSSHSVLGKACLGTKPVDENTAPDLEFCRDTYYDWAKQKAEEVVMNYHKQGKIGVTIIRPAMIWGPRDTLVADRIYRHMSMRIIVWPGKANPLCAPVYVSDIAEAAILAATNPKAVGQIYFVAPPEPVWFRDFCNCIIKAQGGWRIQFTIPYAAAHYMGFLTEVWTKVSRSKDQPYLSRSSVRFLNEGMCLDGSKIRRELGWEQKVSMEEGARRFVSWKRSEGKKK